MLLVVGVSHLLVDSLSFVYQDESGVGGFFEDLPVLVFVLAGTCVMILSAVSVSDAIVSREKIKELEYLANRCADRVVSELVGAHPGAVIMVESLCATRLCKVISDCLDGHGFRMGIAMVHPVFEWLLEASSASSAILESASSSSRLANGLTDEGYIAVLVVRIIVW